MRLAIARNSHTSRTSLMIALACALAWGALIISCGGSKEPEPAPESSTPATEATPTTAESTPEATPMAESPAASETPAAEPAATETPVAEPPAQSSAGEVSGSGSGVSGVAMLDGQAPARKLIRMEADPGCAAMHANEKVGTVDALVRSTGEIKNVFVYVKNGGSIGNNATPQDAVELDQIGCMYEPHVVGVQVNQPLNIVNSDNVSHNIHCLAEINREFNFGQPTPGMREHVFRKQENSIKIKCDIHPWMGAYIFVTDHPYFAVTDGQGQFSIPNLPAGQYTLVAWHEVFGEREMQVTVPATGSANIKFTFTS